MIPLQGRLVIFFLQVDFGDVDDNICIFGLFFKDRTEVLERFIVILSLGHDYPDIKIDHMQIGILLQELLENDKGFIQPACFEQLCRLVITPPDFRIHRALFSFYLDHREVENDAGICAADSPRHTERLVTVFFELEDSHAGAEPGDNKPSVFVGCSRELAVGAVLHVGGDINFRNWLSALFIHYNAGNSDDLLSINRYRGGRQ